MASTIGELFTTLFASNINEARQVRFGVGFGTPEDSQQFPFDELLIYTAGAGLSASQSGIDIATGGVVSSMIATGAVGTDQLGDASVTSAKLAAGSVVTTAIADGNVTEAKLALNSVNTPALVNASVTSEKLASDALGSENALAYGADPTGTTPSAAAIQAALDTGKSVYVPDGTYLIDSTLTLTAVGQVLFGNGDYATRLVSTITNGSPTVSTNAQVSCNIRNLGIWGQTQSPPYQNTIGLAWANSTRAYLSNVDIRYCNNGFVATDSWVLTAINLWVRDCVTGTQLTQINASSLQINTANVGQGLVMTSSNGTLIEYSVEGSVPTVSSSIENCVGLNFTKFYVEHNPAGLVPEFVIGASQRCRGLEFHGINVARGGDSVATWAFDDVEGVHLGQGNFGNGITGLAWTTTANTRGLESSLQGAAGQQGNYLPPPVLSTRPLQNLYRDPYLIEGLPEFNLETRVSVSESTSVVPEGMQRSIALTVTAATFAHAEIRLDLTSDRYKALLGQQCGVGAQIFAPDTPNYQSDAGRCSIYAEVDGTGGGAVPTRNQDYLPGQWVNAWNELAIPSDATILTVRLYANQSSDDMTGEVVHFGAVSVWLGGNQTADKFYKGQLEHLGDELELQAPNTILANADAFLTVLPKPVEISALPSVAASPGVVALVQAPTGLAHTDLSTITAGSRKDGVDQLTLSASTLAINFDDGQYDNKEVLLDRDVVDITLTATRQTNYELRFRQDATGFRDVFMVTTNISPNITQVLLNPDSDEVSIMRLKYDGSTFHWG